MHGLVTVTAFHGREGQTVCLAWDTIKVYLSPGTARKVLVECMLPFKTNGQHTRNVLGLGTE